MRILNLTIHNMTKEQMIEGVFEPNPHDKEMILVLLNFQEIPDWQERRERAERLAAIASEYQGCDKEFGVMIGGAPFLMSVLERELMKWHMIPMYSFSKRVSTEEVQPDGTTVKKSVFKHLAFIVPA